MKDGKKINLIFYYIMLFLYLELLTKIFITKSFNGSIYTILFSLPIICILFLLNKILKEKANKVITFIISIIFILYYVFQFLFFKLFGIPFSFSTIGMATQAIEFIDIMFNTIIKNIFIVLLYFIPLILLIIFNKKIEFTRITKRGLIISVTSAIGLYLIAILSLIPYKSKIYSAYNLYFNVNSEIKNINTFGLFTATRIDIKRLIFGFDEELIVTEKPIDEENKPEEPTIEEPTYNVTEINFDELIANEDNKTIKNILSYLSKQEPSNKNDYTGMFKGKNLIFILAEGFNMIAVNKELTPTLYKLTHEGFVFNNFYSPVFLSTTGGEFQATTGLIPTQEILANWKKDEPTIKYALGNSFKNIGYNAQSFHNWTYTYYQRHKTMKTLGFDNYMGCGNGMEEKINCGWLPSDVDMINTTFPLYKNNNPFITYYVSVSGHAPYAFTNSMAYKNKGAVKDLNYSETVKAYLATQIEFDHALEALIKSLEEEGILDDTVISFVGDHYPYTLTIDEVNELSTYKRDNIVEVNRSNFVIWNNSIKSPIEVNKVGSQIDVLPTLLNLFGIDYDSRLIIGQDILSDKEGMAIFSNRSWVSDYGTYRNGVFTLKSGKNVEDTREYINYMNNIVANRFTMSNQLIKYDMYNYILN